MTHNKGKRPLYQRGLLISSVLCAMAVAAAQQTESTASVTAVPRLVRFAGTFHPPANQPAGMVGATFAIYSEQEGGTAVWSEDQNVDLDANGNYSLLLGATKNGGVPMELFTSNEPRWLQVKFHLPDEVTLPRVLLVSVPYALKAADAETVGGMPASAFALATPAAANVTAANVTAAVTPNGKATPLATMALGGSGTTNYVPLWTNSTGTLGNSVMFQSGTGSTAKVGINTTAPTATLDVKGAATVEGAVSATSYQIGTSVFATGNSSKSNAFLGFAGNSTMTGTSNTGVGSDALFLNSTGGSNTAEGYVALFGNSTGTDNTGIGAGALYSNGTGTYNTGTGYDALYYANATSTNTATGALSAYFISGSNNTADGFKALYGTTPSLSTGVSNAAIGSFALFGNTSGSYNTAIGASALAANTSGSYNTALGYLAGSTTSLNYELSGLYNTFVGYQSGPTSQTALYNAAAIGANAAVGVNNALILGGKGSNAVTVGIGTSTPYYDYALDVEATPGGAINGGIVSNSTGGNIMVGLTNGTHKFRVDYNGVTYADGGFQSSGADFAESFAVRGKRSQYGPGDVLTIDPKSDRHLTLSHQAYATLVAGIYSTKPGLLATPHHIDDPTVQESEVPLAVVGIVPCKVTAENGAVARGDLLVTSSRPGYAMKGTNRQRMLGAVVGKALEPLPKGTGVIQVLVTLQ